MVPQVGVAHGHVTSKFWKNNR